MNSGENVLCTRVYPLFENNIGLGKKLRGPGTGYVNGAGGKVLPGDRSIARAASRELLEEFGVDALRLIKIATLDFHLENYSTEDWTRTTWFETHAFVAPNVTGTLRSSSEMEEVKFYNITALPLDRMWPSDLLWLPEALSGTVLHGEFDLDPEGVVKRSIIVERGRWSI